MKPLGIGVRYNSHTKKYEARLGAKHLGFHRTLEDAAKAYNDDARKVFSFPILNKNEVAADTIENIFLDIPEEVKKLVPEKINIIEQPKPTAADNTILSLDESMELLKG